MRAFALNQQYPSSQQLVGTQQAAFKALITCCSVDWAMVTHNPGNASIPMFAAWVFTPALPK
jgi:hypothetical protein